MEPRVCIVILNWNGKKDTLPCLESVQKICYSNFFTVVVDNGSTDDSVKAIQKEYPAVTVLETGQNLGYAGGNNVGIEFGLKQGAERVFLLNNDTLVDKNILQAMVQKEDAIAGAMPYAYPETGRLDHLGGKWNPKKGIFDLIGLGQTDEELNFDGKLDYVTGCSILIHRGVFEKIGLLEPKFFLLWEESDFCTRASKAGFTIGVAHAKLFHKGSASFVGGKVHSKYFWWRNRLLWIERNCSIKEKLSLFFVIAGEILNLYKFLWLKSMQLPFAKDREKSRKQIRLYKASIQGVHDYLCRRFGNGPSWIYNKPS